MTTFHSRQSERGRRIRKMATASTLNFPVTNCTAKLHGHFHEGRRIMCNNFQRAVQAHVMELLLYAKQALPLVKTRFLRLVKISPLAARSPARRSRDSRATSGKTSGAISAQLPGNSRAVATAMPPDGRRDSLQDNLPCAGCECAMSAPETGETTRLKSQP